MKTNVLWVIEEKYDSTSIWDPIDMHSSRKSARDTKKSFEKYSDQEKFRIVKYVSQGVAE